MELLRATFRGVILERTGRAPKCAVPLYAPEPFKKVIRKFSAPDGKVHKIEVLGDGQQFVVSGTPWEWPGHDPAAFEAAVRRAEAVFLKVMAQLKKRGKRLSDKRGVNFAPKLIAETPEAKEMRVNETVLVEAMGRLIEFGRLEVFDGYKDGKPVHELRVPE